MKTLKTQTHKKLQELSKIAHRPIHKTLKKLQNKLRTRTLKKLQELQNLQNYPRLHMDPSTKHCKICENFENTNSQLTFFKAPAQP